LEEHGSSRSTRSSRLARLARLARQSRTCRVESSQVEFEPILMTPLDTTRQASFVFHVVLMLLCTKCHIRYNNEQMLKISVGLHLSQWAKN